MNRPMTLQPPQPDPAYPPCPADQRPTAERDDLGQVAPILPSDIPTVTVREPFRGDDVDSPALGTGGAAVAEAAVPQPALSRRGERRRRRLDAPPAASLPPLPLDGPVGAEIDRALTAAALAAQGGDGVARDELYAALAAKIAGFAGRYDGNGWGNGAWDGDDVRQEAYLVLVDLVATWPGGDSFVAYFLSRFPWRLRDAVRRLMGPRPASPRPGNPALALMSDGSAAAEATRVLVEAIAADLAEPDRTILWCRVGEGEQFGAIADRLGIDRRTVHRRWQALVSELRRSLTTAGDTAERA